MIFVIVFIAILLSICGSSKRSNQPDDNTPVSYWLNERNGCLNDWSKACVQQRCVTDSARAIVRSGRPYPNEVRDKTGRLVRYDVWIGKHLYEISSQDHLFTRSAWYPSAHPFAYRNIRISISDLLNVPDSRHKDLAGGDLNGNFDCIDLADYPDIKSKYIASNSIDQAIKMAQDVFHEKPNEGEDVMVVDRKDIQMIEVTVTTKLGERAAYIPYKKPLLVQKVNGVAYYNQIYCNRRYDPNAPEKFSETCGTHIKLEGGYYLNFDVKQKYMTSLPAIQSRILSILDSSKRN